MLVALGTDYQEWQTQYRGEYSQQQCHQVSPFPLWYRQQMEDIQRVGLQPSAVHEPALLAPVGLICSVQVNAEVLSLPAYTCCIWVCVVHSFLRL